MATGLNTYEHGVAIVTSKSGVRSCISALLY